MTTEIVPASARPLVPSTPLPQLFLLIRSQIHSLGCVTRRAPSDPACILPHFVSHPPHRSEKAPSEDCGRRERDRELCIAFLTSTPPTGLPHVDGPLGGLPNTTSFGRG